MKTSLTIAALVGALAVASVPTLTYAANEGPEPPTAPNPSDAGASSGSMSKGGAMKSGAMKGAPMKGGAMKGGAMKGGAMMMKKR